MNPIDFTGWAACTAILLGLILQGAGLRLTGRGLQLAGLLTALAAVLVADASPWWALPIGALAGWNATEFGKDLRKGGAR